MRYISTRGGAASHNFEEVVSEGLSRDGGLFVPETFPRFSVEEMEAMRWLSYPELAVRIMKTFVKGALSDGELAALVQEAYSRFSHAEVAPLKSLDDRLYLLELFYGPTLAFKDVALQFLGRVFGHFAHKHKQPLTVLGATSGDTGSAAIEGCRGVPNTRVFILYPHERTSEVQRRQMTTVDAANTHVLAVKGSFDDCQALLKAAFNDAQMRDQHHLTAVNSINWARVMAQIVYYFYAGLKAGALQKPVNFVVPTGNFGNVYAGYVAKQLGLPIAKLVIATNRNDSLARFVNTGAMTPGHVEPSYSPSMDIQIASNAERYIFEALGRDAEKTRAAMASMKEGKSWQLPEATVRTMQETFMALKVSDEETVECIRAAWQKYHELIDPHTAVAVHAAQKLQDKLEGPIIALACAHPAKFPDVVKQATGQIPTLPAHLADIYQRKEHYTVIENSYAALTDVLAKHM
jgi:threonine synthase